MQLKLTFLALVMLSSQALAGTDISIVENSQTTQSQTQSLQQKAGEWGLSPEDYQRYQQLMNGPRGIQSPGLDPLSALGIEARTPAERRQYAEKWVKEEFARTQKELDFQREINTAWQRLYPDRLPVNLGNAAGVARDTRLNVSNLIRRKSARYRWRHYVGSVGGSLTKVSSALAANRSETCGASQELNISPPRCTDIS